MTETMFKPEYDGERPKGTLSGPEKHLLSAIRSEVIERLHAAMLTQCALDGPDDLGIRAGGIPQNLIEFSDMVGQEAPDAPPARFRPSPADVDAMPKALALLNGLRKHFYTVVKMRAINEFAASEGEGEPFPWSEIGDYFGYSGRWAEAIYDAAIVQAARRAGFLPMVSTDFGVVVAAVWLPDGTWLTNLSSAANPRAAVANLRIKSPVRIDRAAVVWVAGEPVAKRILSELKPKLRGAQDHHAWYRLNPETLTTDIIECARRSNAAWFLEELFVSGPEVEEYATEAA